MPSAVYLLLNNWIRRNVQFLALLPIGIWTINPWPFLLSFLQMKEQHFWAWILASRRSGTHAPGSLSVIYFWPQVGLSASLWNLILPPPQEKQSSLDILPVWKPKSELFILNICDVAMDPGLKNNIWATLFLKEKHKYSQGYAVIPNLCFLEMQVLRAWWISAESVILI